MPARGSRQAKYAFISDSPTKRDTRDGYVWSDRKIVELLHEAGIAEDDCIFTNLLKCSSEVDPTIEQGRACMGYLLRELMTVRPKVAFVTGRLSFQLLTRSQEALTIGEARGQIYTVKMPWGDMLVIPTWGPGFARHRVSAAQDVVADLITGIAVLSPPRPKNYRWINTPEDLIQIVDHIIDLYRTGGLQFGFIAVDTESTNLIASGVDPAAYSLKHNIGTVQVAWNPGYAFAVPVIRKDSVFNTPYNIVVLRTQLARLLEEIPVVGQNYKFDELYFNIKLGIHTKNFHFDTMLGHHFYSGGSLPSRLEFQVPRYLGWVSHKRVIEEELAAMPDDDRRYSNLSVETILEYGCSDADATLQLAPVLIEKLKARTYEAYKVPVIYSNMYEAFRARVMFPWRALKNIELRGAPLDAALLPVVREELETRMNAAYGAISGSPVHAVWMIDHTIPNPKRRVYEKKAVHYLNCTSCGRADRFLFEGKRPKTAACPACHAVVKVTWKMEKTDRFSINENEPETLTSEINLRSPNQVSEFFYSPRYLNLPVHDDLGQSTDKKARAWLLDYCEKAQLSAHAKILISIGEYNKASKLYTAYATKIGDYLHIQSPDQTTSSEVTARYEINTGVNHIHTNYYQDGTVSGRLSTRKPSLHTIPRKSTIKTLFISRFGSQGIVLQNDLSQAEVRAFVIETGDEYLRDAFQKGLDPYIQMAAITFSVRPEDVTEEQRQNCKSIVLGLLFGRGPTAIAEQTKKSVGEIRDIIENFFGGMPKLQNWIRFRHDFVDRHRCAVSRFGRIRPLVDEVDADDDEMLNHAHNIGVNHPIQGLVGDLCIDSVARIEYRLEALGLKSVIFNTVHDSTIVDVYLPELVQVMTICREEMFSKLTDYFPWINVPFAIDQELGNSWGNSVKSQIKDGKLVMAGSVDTVNAVFTKISRVLKVASVKPEPIMKGDQISMKMTVEFAA